MLAYSMADYNTDQRCEGFVSSLKRHKISRPKSRVIRDYETTEEFVEWAVERMGQENPPTAIYAVNDTLAYYLIKGLQENGIRVPEDVSVVGVDDDIIAAKSEPGLTTVRVNKRDVGDIGAKLLLDKVANPKKKVDNVLQEVSLVVRDSVKDLNA